MNNYLCEQKLTARLRIAFCHLDSQLKQFIRMKKCPCTPKDILSLFDTHYLSIYNSFIAPRYIECSYEFQNFNWYANYKVNIDESFWSKCWSTFIHRFSLETHILINDTKTCYGNRLLDLWISSVMDNFWLHVQFPEEENPPKPRRREEEETEEYEDEYEESDHEEKEPLINPFHIKFNSQHKSTKRRHKKKVDSDSSIDSDVS
jgi:hypothetical protein